MIDEKISETSLVLPVTPEFIERRVLLVLGKKVMLDSVLAELYQVPTKYLNQMVRRNISRFPEDFMMRLNQKKVESLRLQIATSKISRGGRRYLPYIFTELGVAMLSSVLKSDRAVQMNIFIMRAFVKLRELIATNKDLSARMDELERKQQKNGESLVAITSALNRLADELVKQKGKMGFER